MIYKGLRIKTPSANFIKKMQDFKGNPYTSFLYNYSAKNEKSGKYEIKERYVINIFNIVPNADSEIICTNIVNCKPQIMKSKDGRDFLNCVVTIEADNVSEPKLSTYVNNPNAKPSNVNVNQQNTYQDNVQQYNSVEIDEDLLPF